MHETINHFALYDGLSIAHKLDDFLDAFKLNEIHLFSYFASILYLYEGGTPDIWAYRYIINDGYPFSEDLQKTLELNIQNGWLEKNDDYFKISSRGTDEFNLFKNLDVFKFREKYIDAACTTSVLLPYSQTLRALKNDPDILKAAAINSSQWLEQNYVCLKFKELSEYIGVPTGDLTISSISWIQQRLNELKGEH